MNINTINNYINRLTKNDIYYLSLKQNILLNTGELDYLYNYIKNDYLEIIMSPINITLNKLKDNLSYDTYNKIYYLYNIYKEKIINIKNILMNNN